MALPNGALKGDAHTLCRLPSILAGSSISTMPPLAPACSAPVSHVEAHSAIAGDACADRHLFSNLLWSSCQDAKRREGSGRTSRRQGKDAELPSAGPGQPGQPMHCVVWKTYTHTHTHRHNKN